ncbi:MAG: ACT domain-containing protein [Pseudomonadota bacterium]
MKQNLIISAIGQDRPGLVNQLSNLIIQNNGSIDDSRMTVLAGEFAIIIKVSADKDKLIDLQNSLKLEMPKIGLDYLSKMSNKAIPTERLIPYNITVLAIDNPGIVNNLSDYFSKLNINIIRLQTDCYPAPHTGTPMFSMKMTISLFENVNISTIKENFIELCEELNLDTTFEALTP